MPDGNLTRARVAQNENLTRAREAQKDEFYTQFQDIETEVNAYLELNPDVFRDKTILLPCDDPEWSNFTKYFVLNFEFFGLRKLISTCYAMEGASPTQPIKFVSRPPHYNAETSETHGKILVLERNDDIHNNINLENLHWDYLEGDGDFRSAEITALRDEADIIITNPPFSLFRQFFAWIVEANKQFLIIGNMNAVTSRDIFPQIKDNKMWYGCSISSGDREFCVPEDYPLEAAGWRIDEKGNKYIRVKGVRWFTNLDHGRRHLPLPLMTMSDNLKFSRHNDLMEKHAYEHYDNYNAIEVPYTEVIPSGCDDVMGVPISFLDKYCPEQFELMGITDQGTDLSWLRIPNNDRYDRPYLSGKRMYARLIIRKKQ
ncbi:MAG: adenine-specific methyltransferase EcoRI family protein [Muribaculaceae bacterium]|nr:adenine-specific methyltransferase EcoRI family protein [Muribaculaceae bacterium]